VNDVPRQFDPSSSFSIVDPAQDLEIELSVHGVEAGFTSCKPTVQEMELYPHYELASKSIWGPNDGSLAEAESRVVKAAFQERTSECATIRNDDNADLYDHVIGSVTVAAENSIGDGLDGNEDEEVYKRCPEVREISALSTEERRWVITPEILSQQWGIGLDTANKTLRATTQAGVRNVLAPTERKVCQRLDHLKFPTLSGRIFTDTMISKRSSIRQFKAAQVFTDGSGFDHFYPIDTKGDAHEALLDHIKEVAIPQTLVSDGSKEQQLGKFKDMCRKYHIRRQFTVPYSPWQNLAEASIRELKSGIRRAMRRSRSPKALWCYCGRWIAAIRRLMSMPKLEDRTPIEKALGSTPDISQYCQFDWYEPIFYWDRTATFPNERKCLGRWLMIVRIHLNKA
jgi:hypothetical protein